MGPGAEKAVERLLGDVVASHRSRLGRNLVGVYLHGSRATGDHGPGSDVDYLVVVERALSLAEKRGLVADLRELSQRAPAHGIEMSVITRDTLRHFRHPAPFELHFSCSWLKRYDRGDVDLEERRTDPDLSSHVVATRERGRVLYGEAIDPAFGAIDRRHHLEATINDARQIVANPAGDPLYTVLNLSRALAVVEEGIVASKLEAANWALGKVPREFHALIVEARRSYLAGDTSAELDTQELSAFVDYMRDALGLEARSR